MRYLERINFLETAINQARINGKPYDYLSDILRTEKARAPREDINDSIFEEKTIDVLLDLTDDEVTQIQCFGFVLDEVDEEALQESAVYQRYKSGFYGKS